MLHRETKSTKRKTQRNTDLEKYYTGVKHFILSASTLNSTHQHYRVQKTPDPVHKIELQPAVAGTVCDFTSQNHAPSHPTLQPSCLVKAARVNLQRAAWLSTEGGGVCI